MVKNCMEDRKAQYIQYDYDIMGNKVRQFTYDVNSNLTKTVDKNGNIQKNTYDYQNRLTKIVAKRKLSKKGARDNLWGIYADKKYAAKALAFVLKSDSAPKVHGRGFYGHFLETESVIGL